jgi:formylmethanofuran dehydrogenase subunit E
MMDRIYERSAAAHDHLCPRQVLGVRMGLLAGETLGIQVPQSAKRLLAVVETDGCFVDGLTAATRCRVGSRTLRINDYGKIAAQFMDKQNGRVIRIAPRRTARAQVERYAPDADSRWHAYVLGYQVMPDERLFKITEYIERPDLDAELGSEHDRALCAICNEEIFNGREVVYEGTVLCRPCAGRDPWSPSG